MRKIFNVKSLFQRYPLHGWLGLGFITFFWILNWSLSGRRTHLVFFPLWLGYCLTVDALVYVRKGSSLLKRSFRNYIGLFLLSAPFWWLFELINWRTQNWFYDGKQFFTDFEYFLLASLSFSTVMPAVFGTAELISTLKWSELKKQGPTIKSTKSATLFLFFLGWLLLIMLLLWPRYFFPFVWLSVYFILDPINVWLNNRSLLKYTQTGNWQPVLSLWFGCLICGFFWEMWNFYSYPKWIYEVPHVNFLHVFEMPLLGYLGYLPFSLELFALYHLAVGFFKNDDLQKYIQIAVFDD